MSKVGVPGHYHGAMTTWLGIAALLVSLISVIIALLARRDSFHLAHTAEAAEHRALTPQLEVILSEPAPAPADRVIYRLRNNGPQDLEDIVIYRPRVRDQIIYPIALTGSDDWAKDEIHLGPVELGQDAPFTFCCGVAQELPEFRVRIACNLKNKTWEMTQLLTPPRG